MAGFSFSENRRHNGEKLEASCQDMRSIKDSVMILGCVFGTEIKYIETMQLCR